MTTGQGASRAVKGYMLNMEQMTLIGMRESKAVRRSVLAKLKVMHCPVIPKAYQKHFDLLLTWQSIMPN